ncbi:hypothetical protein ACSFA0_23385 [Variovorax sp. LT1P1]|uniref:hypothetical protein n=1 Tax=Variovorax sp. LT1P1 TaxID=3443730 RepID=UPI003F47C7E0
MITITKDAARFAKAVRQGLVPTLQEDRNRLAEVLESIAAAAPAEAVLCVSSKEFSRLRAGDDSSKAWLPPATGAEDMLLYAARAPSPADGGALVDPVEFKTFSVYADTEFRDSEGKLMAVVNSGKHHKRMTSALRAELQQTQGA